MTYNVSAAWGDLSRGTVNWHLWGRLGWQEVKRRYRRTVIGPFWTSISLAVLVVTLGFLWSGLWSQETRAYLPFLASGLVVWMMVSTMITEGGTVFVGAEGIIKQLRFDYSVLTFALIWRNLIVFGHNFLVFLVIAAACEVKITPATWLALPGLLLVALNGFWIATLSGLVCLRFRDIQQLIASLLQIAIFVTPIFWSPERLPASRLIFVNLNPLYHLIVIVRSPLLGQVPPTESYMAVLAMSVVGSALTLVIFDRFRSRIPYWS